MTKPHGAASIALIGWALYLAQGTVGQERHMVSEATVSPATVRQPRSIASHFPPTAPPPLFTHASSAVLADFAESPTTPSGAGHDRSRAVQIDFAQLSQAHEALAEGRDAGLTLNLSEDSSLSVSLTNGSETRQGYALSGHLVNDPLSAVNIVVNGRTVAGNIRRAGELHTIRTAGAAYLVQTRDHLHTGPFCEVERSGELALGAGTVPPMHSPAIAQDNGGADDGTEIDVLVVYTQAGRRSAGGHQGIRTLIELLVKETNQAYRDSDVRQRLRLVAATEVDYEIGDLRDALTHLTETQDGHLDEVHEIRDLYAADLVLLWSPSGGGIAWHVADPLGATAERFGFSVSASHYFAHELGHNMGLMHERLDDNRNLPYPYSHGYRASHRGLHYRTIMHRDPSLLRSRQDASRSRLAS